MAPTPEEWYATLPVITKYYFSLSLVVTLMADFLNIITPYHIHLEFYLIFNKFQLWRFISNFFFFGPVGLNFVFQIVILVRYFNMLEEGYYQGPRGTSDMIFMCLFGSTLFTLIAYFWPGLYFLGPCLVFMVIYVWSRKDPHMPVIFYGFSFQAWHTPFLFMLLSGVLSKRIVYEDVFGIAVGHFYHFLTTIVPRVYGYDLLKTPDWLYRLVESGLYAVFVPPSSQWQRAPGYRLSQ